MPNTAPASGSIFTDTVNICCGESDWSDDGRGLQLCPAIFLPERKHIPQAVKHIYSKLAASSLELDEGVPELILSLSATGNSFNFEVSCRTKPVC